VKRIAEVWSPERENVIATHMRGLADLAARSAELRVKARVAEQTLETARSYLRETEEAVERVADTSFASTAFRLEMFRERAAARKTVVSQEAEAAEALAQLAKLDELDQHIRGQLEAGARRFGEGRILAPISGIVPTKPAREGQSVVAGSPIAEIRDPSDIYINWYLPDYRLADPEVGSKVVVVFGHRRLYGTVIDIFRVSDVFSGEQTTIVFGERTVSQVARVRLDPGVELPPLGSQVAVHMYYTAVAGHVANILIRIFGLAGIDDSSDVAPGSRDAN
jgi:multidrug efflux pump subunit AcrA (membrane-fusion protein)